jgi:putative FmdB family regulatory protein
MPIYEYKCPNGHHFEVFHGMTEPSPERCEVCGAEPLQRVLHPVAVHYKGSGFYSTDYGKGGRKPKDSGSSDSSSSSSSSSDGGSSSSDSGSSSPYNADTTKKIKESGGGSSSGGSGGSSD